MLRIVRGEPSDEELAALITVLAALPNTAAEPPAPRSAWADPAYRLRTPDLGRRQWRRPR
ncbi:MAG: acetyl-CoA carboxylase biotin carboxyl carrier protein subunit [Pseudonocardiales bacterium]|nr:MAG: acetyl-CoA carboxylase biotin carboxyl carrier protein subunit [Pseudonocardiales bacterium]